MIALLAVTMAMVAWKYRQWHDELWAAFGRLQRRVDSLESRLQELEQHTVREECRRNEYAFTTRTPIDMEAKDVY